MGKLGMNNLTWSVVGNAAMIYCLVFANDDAIKVTGYAQIPLLLLYIYNAFGSKAASELIDPAPRIVFTAIQAVLVAATLM